MEEFVRALPAAATNPYALAAYGIAALLFLFGGMRLRMVKILMAQMTLIPEKDRLILIEMATETVLPKHVSSEQWIRHTRLRWTFLLLVSLLIVLLVVSTIAILNPTTLALTDINKTTYNTAKETQSLVLERTRAITDHVDESTEQIVNTVRALKNKLPAPSQETKKPISVKATKNGKPYTIPTLSGERE